MFVKQAAAASAGAVLMGVVAGCGGSAPVRVVTPTEGAVGLSLSEKNTLKSLLAQLLPSDKIGPGAVEAGVPTYIDTALSGPYKALLPAYQGFLAILDKAAKIGGAGSFESLSPEEQTAVLKQVESGKAPGASATEQTAAAAIFPLVLELMREGMFGDPMYGGNQNLAGWKLIGYPGIQLVATDRVQAFDVNVQPTNATAASYGGASFNGPGNLS